MPEIDVDSLVDEVCRPRGCRVSHIEDGTALDFISKVMAKKRQGKNPNLERVSELLEERWGIVIPRRSLSDHVRGKCSCPKK